MFKSVIGAILALATAVAMAAVDVNQADRAELETVRGIGAATAERILEERENGAYRNWADLIVRLPGIGDARAARLSDAGLTVNGRALGEDAAGTAPATAARSAARPAAEKTTKPAGNR